MSDERIMTLHPDEGKSGVNISKQKYDDMHSAILKALEEEDEPTFSELGDAVKRQLEGHFDGSIGWYYTTVKLDLEARGVIERVEGSRPQRIRLVK
jgi:porphobilinogen deaminase